MIFQQALFQEQVPMPCRVVILRNFEEIYERVLKTLLNKMESKLKNYASHEILLSSYHNFVN